MRILILANNQIGLYKFRRELLEKLIKNNKVYVSVPKENEFYSELKEIGVKIVNNNYLDRRGTNPIKDFRLLKYYRYLVKKIKPQIVLTYTIKPNIYGGVICRILGIPYVVNITGLGTSIENNGLLQKITLFMYKVGIKKAQKVFFQNSENRDFMLNHKTVNPGITDMLPGSGVNTEQHCYEPYPNSDTEIIFTTIGRIMKDKGIDEVLGAAEIIKQEFPYVSFRLIGEFDEDYESIIKQKQEKGIIDYLGYQNDVHPFMIESHAIIHASYHEGMSNILLEAASTGRPVIATNVHGCIEAFEPNVTGIDFNPRSTTALVNAIRRFLKLSHEEKERMGLLGREKVVKEFSRQIVIDKYLKEIEKVK